MPTALLVISDREPLAWLLREHRFAIPAARMSSAPAKGTRLLLYTTRGCYRNPTRDRGLVMGVATVTSNARLLDEPVVFVGREFRGGFDVAIEGVAPPHDGVELGQFAGKLDALPDARSWSARLRRSVIPLTARDASRLFARLRPSLQPLSGQLLSYLEACHVQSSVRPAP